ncbi:hypothetical protein CXP39_03615 [Mesoplasma syrphidae]|uniref:ABC transporter permease n=1 Tax=Mesoplasma syrphidae TaxID=225999 RepID=A0A2K9BS74_9MOLU|nr:hypothetical protein [Mesoplasma syrphidae]AUF83852.1 hypothetical protein CXP39_03615 [Mesoplasma syrphidae]
MKNTKLAFFDTKKAANLGKIVKASLLSSLKNERAWVFVIFSSTIFSVACFIGYSTFSNSYELLPPQMVNIFLIPSFISTTYFAIFLSEWKDSSLIKRIRFLGIKKWSIIFSFILCAVLFAFIGEIFTIFATYLVSLMFIRVKFYYVTDLFFWNWIWFAFVTILITTTTFLLSTCIGDLWKNKNLRFSTPLIIIIILILTSDIVIPSFISARSPILTYAGYLSLTKYPAWISLVTSSFTFADYNGGIQQIIYDEGMTETVIFLNNLAALIIISILTILVLFLLSIKTFKWK